MEPFDGETPLQAIARQAAAGLQAFPESSMTSLQRFPYYTAFPFAWYPITVGDQLAPGEVRPVRLLARDLVLWRDDDGTAHVMDAYCPHLGANLGIGGRVENGNLVCPYHWWEWAADGTNAGIPHSERTNRKARLRIYPTIERNGLVLFWFHPDPEQAPLWEIPDLGEYLTDDWVALEPAEWSVRCPWQELAENAPDYIHLRTVHGAASVPDLESLDYDGYGPGFSIARFSGIVDTVFFNVTVPIDWETTWSMKLYRVRGSARVGEALVRDLKKQMAEDNVIFDNKIQQQAPALAGTDGPIMQFRTWAAQFYVDGDPVAEGRAAR